MAVQPLDFSHLLGNLRGISDRALTAHLALYQQAVDRLNAIEAAYPVVEWRAANAPASDATTEALLRTPVARLDLRPVGPLAEYLQTVDSDLAARGVAFRPAWYLGTGGEDFWTADRATSINIPWMYSNPTLWRLANRSARYAYTPEELLKTLRHEAGHALCYAFELWREPGWQAVFGDSRAPYREDFTPVEGSRDFVEYLVGVRAHYAQKHPDEDWAETFACWLDPASNWRQQYAEWPGALRKLEYVEACWAAGKFSGLPVNTYLGRREPYQMEARTVATAEAQRGLVGDRYAEETGTYSHDTRVPRLAEEDDPRVGPVALLDHPLRLRGDLSLDVLALPVEGVQLLGGLPRKLDVLGEEELHRERGVGEAAGRVDARTEPEGDVDRLEHLRARDPRDVHERPQPRARRLLEDPQAVLGQNPVLAHQRHHIRHRPDRHQIQILRGHGAQHRLR